MDGQGTSPAHKREKELPALGAVPGATPRTRAGEDTMAWLGGWEQRPRQGGPKKQRGHRESFEKMRPPRVPTSTSSS